MADISIKEVTESLSNRFFPTPVHKVDKEKVMSAIRDLADSDESFENLVFEVGCRMIADYYVSGGSE